MHALLNQIGARHRQSLTRRFPRQLFLQWLSNALERALPRQPPQPTPLDDAAVCE
jgi:hypothetical protein